MATTRIMPLHIGKGRTESQAISDIIDYVANPQKTDNGKLIQFCIVTEYHTVIVQELFNQSQRFKPIFNLRQITAFR